MLWRTNLTRQRDITFKQFLLENDDEDIVSGLRAVVNQIRSGWSSNYSGVKKQQEQLWKKLSDAQKQRMKTTFDTIVNKLFSAPNQVIDVSVIDATDRNEAAFIVATFAALATGAKEIDLNFLNAMVQQGVIEKRDRDTMMTNYGSTGPADVTLGNVTAKFLSDHASMLKKLIDIREESIVFSLSNVTNNLIAAIGKTEDAKKKEAVTAVHYFLLDISHEFDVANKATGQKFSKANLPEKEEEK